MSKVDVSQFCSHNEKEIKGFFLDYRFLSNFHVCDVEFEGIVYPSSENAYMAAKTLDLKVREKFLNIKPVEARKLGQEIELRKDWEFSKLYYMFVINLDKYRRNKDIKQKLIETGNKYLEETNWWNDKFYGVCNNTGQNWLGKIIMQVRTELTKKV